jgi:methylase of polypeptide subunit release factors
VKTSESASASPDSTAKAVVRDLASAGGPGFRVGPVSELLGPVALGALGRDALLPAELATTDRPDDPLAVLTRLWLLGLPVARGVLDQALPTAGTAGAEALGLVQAAGRAGDDEVRPLLELSPYAADDNEWWLASDLTHTGRPLRPDHVLGVGGASTTLARWTPRTTVGTALDIGTGCGVQAFHLALHAGAVTATDTSERCLRVARLNALLNAGAADGPFAGRAFDLRQGSLLAPVAGQRFDLVVSNPPYVITPRSAAGHPSYAYRDGGLAGDDVVRHLVEHVGAVLTVGGTAQLLGNWEHRRGEGWRDRIGEWLDASGLHGWVVQREVQDPAEYAETWARDGGHRPGTPEHEAMYAAWLGDFAERDVEAIGFGVITVRRPADGASTGVRVRRVEEHLGPTADALGPTVAATMAAEEWLLGVRDAELLATRLVVAADVTEERHGWPGAEDPTVILLRQGGGLRRAARADTALAAVVGACDGDLPVGALVSAVADLTDEPPGAMTARVLPAVRGLVADGLLARAP